MLDKPSFEQIRRELKEFEVTREKTIQNSREIITLSKQIIYAVHRDDLKTAEELVKKIKTSLKEIEKTRHFEIGISNVAFQEFVEAISYYEFIKNKKIPGLQELNVKVEDYLLGMCDLSGELVRKAVAYAIKNKFNEILEIKEVVEGIYGELLRLDLRDWEMRKKADSVKWNLNKLEDMVFTMKTGGRIGTND